MDLSVVPYSDLADAAGTASAAGTSRYRECMRNHAAAMGGQAYDGCGEFMPGGDEGSLEALKCAACGCHRNFHRREGAGAGPGDPPRPLLLYNPAWDPKKRSPPPPQPPSGFPPFFPAPHPMPLSYHQIRPPSAPIGPDPSRDGSETPPRPTTTDDRRRDEAGRKRFRTKFTAEQKERMREFAERLGWRIQKHDDEALEEFCVEVGVKRHVLKVWMHNNKNALASHHATNSHHHHHHHHHHSATDSPRNPSPNRETSTAPTPIQV